MTETEAISTVAGVLVGFVLIVLLIALAVSLVILIAKWKAYSKAGEQGWKVLIPIYNQYTLCKIVGVSPWWILIVFIGTLLNGIPFIGSLISLAASIYFLILLNVSVAKAYGKDAGFAVGLILLPIVFWPILGFGKAEFVGADPMNDVIMGMFGQNNTTSTTKTTTTSTQTSAPVAPVATETVTEAVVTETKTCANCGAALASDAKFCTGCGTEAK